MCFFGVFDCDEFVDGVYYGVVGVVLDFDFFCVVYVDL